jgi:hypothetical protein
MPISSSLLVDASRISIIRNVIGVSDTSISSRIGYDIYTKVPTTSQGGVLKKGTNVTFDLIHKGMIKGIVNSERLGGTMSLADYNTVINDISSSLTR